MEQWSANDLVMAFGYPKEDLIDLVI